MTAGQEDIAFKVFDTMSKPLRADGSTAPIGRFLIAHLTKVHSVRKKNVLNFHCCIKSVTAR